MVGEYDLMYEVMQLLLLVLKHLDHFVVGRCLFRWRT